MNRIIQFFRRSRDYADLADEIQQHLQEEIAALVEAGMSPEQAQQEARRRFGNVARIEEKSREAWGWRWLEDFVADVHYGVRQFGRSRLFTVAAVVTLALAIGACTSIFSVVDAVLLRKLPYKDSDRLVLLWSTGGRTSSRDQISFTDLQDWRENSKSFVEMANFHTYVYTLTEKDHSERVRALQVSDGYFRVMQAAPLLGRFLVAADQQPGNEHVAVLSYDFWQEKFGGDRAVLGKTLTLNLHPYEIIGVAPRSLPSLPNSVIFHPPSQLYTPVVGPYSTDDRTSSAGHPRRRTFAVQDGPTGSDDHTRGDFRPH